MNFRKHFNLNFIIINNVQILGSILCCNQLFKSFLFILLKSNYSTVRQDFIFSIYMNLDFPLIFVLNSYTDLQVDLALANSVTKTTNYFYYLIHY